MRKLVVFIRNGRSLKCLIINGLLAIVAACGSSKHVVYNWQDKPLVATGIEKDWGETSMLDAGSKFWYKVSNDDRNLYIMLKMDDESLKRKVLANGLKIFIDSTNHKKKNFGIQFPVKRTLNPEARAEYMDKPDPQKSNSDRMKERLLEQMQMIELIGINDRESDMLMIGESKIVPVIAVDQYNAFIYQLVLPLGYVYKGKSPKKLISIGFTTGMFERPENRAYGEGRNEMQGRMRGGGGFGRGGGERMGGMGHGRNGGGREDYARSSGSSEFWLNDYCISCGRQNR